MVNIDQVKVGIPAAVVFIVLMSVGVFSILAPLGILALLVTYLFFRWERIFFPFSMGKRMIKRKDYFELSPSRDVLLRREGESFVATMFLSLDVYETMSSKRDEGITDYAGYFERVISSFEEPVKISTILYETDMSNYVDKLVLLKAAAEKKIANAKNDREREIFEREKLMWERRIDSLYKARKKPLATKYIVSVSSKGYSADAAIAAVKNKATEVKAVFSSGLSINVNELAGNQILFASEFDNIIADW